MPGFEPRAVTWKTSRPFPLYHHSCHLKLCFLGEDEIPGSQGSLKRKFGERMEIFRGCIVSEEFEIPNNTRVWWRDQEFPKKLFREKLAQGMGWG